MFQTLRKLVVSFFVLFLSFLIFSLTSGDHRYSHWLAQSADAASQAGVLIERSGAWIGLSLRATERHISTLRHLLLPGIQSPKPQPKS